MLIENTITSNVKMERNKHWVEFGRWLQNEREKTRVSQGKLEKKMGLSVTQISRIENGESGTKRKTVEDYVSSVNELSDSYKIDLDAALEKFILGVASEKIPPPPLDTVGYEGLDENDLEDIADYINYRKSRKKK